MTTEKNWTEYVQGYVQAKQFTASANSSGGGVLGWVAQESSFAPQTTWHLTSPGTYQWQPTAPNLPVTYPTVAEMTALLMKQQKAKPKKAKPKSETKGLNANQIETLTAVARVAREQQRRGLALDVNPKLLAGVLGRTPRSVMMTCSHLVTKGMLTRTGTHYELTVKGVKELMAHANH